MRYFLHTAAVGALLASSAASAQESVTVAEPSWNGARAIAHVVTAIINGPMESEAEGLKGMNRQPVIFAGMDKGDGSVDVHPDMWMPNWQSAWDEYIVDKQTVDHNRCHEARRRLPLGVIRCKGMW